MKLVTDRENEERSVNRYNTVYRRFQKVLVIKY